MMLTDNVKPLQPLSGGLVLLVGVKASNFGDDIKNHPRIIMWDSQNQSWERKDIPDNVRAIFVTRFIGHTTFGKILKEARKKRITIFNPEGTGMIVKQVKELLDMTRKTTMSETIEETTVVTTESTKPRAKTGGKIIAKLNVLHPLIDFSKGPMDNARDILMPKAKELGIETTIGSLAQMVSVLRRKRTGAPKSAPRGRHVEPKAKDVSVDILDNIITELTDLRAYLVATVKENDSLKQRIEKFKRVLDND